VAGACAADGLAYINFTFTPPPPTTPLAACPQSPEPAETQLIQLNRGIGLLRRLDKRSHIRSPALGNRSQ
jgi:hypothetical protein